MKGNSILLWWAIGFTICTVVFWFRYRSERLVREKTEQNAARAREAQSSAEQAARLAKEECSSSKKHFETVMARVLYERQAETRMLKEKTVSFPWLASAIADFHAMLAERDAAELRSKKNPAIKSAEKVAEHGRARRAVEREARILKHRIEYYEKLFPWLPELVGEDVDALLARLRNHPAINQTDAGGGEVETDEAQRYLSKEEYNALSSAERYQRALDRYLLSRKSNWEIGRDYERYVGYLLEKEGFAVEYHGAIEGLDDLGRDIIAKRAGETRIVQCKRWSTYKIINENHIFQLYGTSIQYILTNGLNKERMQGAFSFADKLTLQQVTPWFVTTANLSERARHFAGELGIEVQENHAPTRYPLIKCNISRQGNDRIYHLPFDQQYDRVVIEPDRGELYIDTVAKAEALGFRRALRWRGNVSSRQ